MKIKTFVFLDLETTGLNRPIEITELTLLAIQGKHLRIKSRSVGAENLPRVIDKLTICARPFQNIENGASILTGLHNDNLRYKRRFDIHMGNICLSFLERQAKPICLVAHNGDRYDFDIFYSELKTIGLNIPADVYVADSLKGLREIRKNHTLNEDYQRKAKRTSKYLGQLIKGESLSLSNLVTLLLENPINELHTSEADTINLAKIVCKYCEILNWLDKNARIFVPSDNNDLSEIKGFHPGSEARISLQDEYFDELESANS